MPLVEPTRRAMLRLAAGEHSVGELARPFDMSFAAARHVTVLEEAGLLGRTIDGRTQLPPRGRSARRGRPLDRPLPALLDGPSRRA